MKNYYMSIILLLALGKLLAQTPMQTLDQIVAYYEKSANGVCEMEIAYYEAIEHTAPDYLVDILLVKQADTYYSLIKSDGNTYEQFSDDNISIEVHHNTKTLHYSKQAEQAEYSNAAATATAIDNFMALAKTEGITLDFIQPKKGEQGIRLSAPQASATTFDIYYDDQYRLTRSEMTVKTNPNHYIGSMNNKKVVTLFSYPSYNKTVAVTNFLDFDNGQYRLTKALSDYTLISQN